MKNLLDWKLRDEWAHKKWEFMEAIQEEEPHLWLGWYDLLSLAPISPNGGIYNVKSINESDG